MDLPLALSASWNAPCKKDPRRRRFFHNICAHFYRETPPEMASILGKRVPSIARAARHAFVISARDAASARDNLGEVRHFLPSFLLPLFSPCHLARYR